MSVCVCVVCVWCVVCGYMCVCDAVPTSFYYIPLSLAPPKPVQSKFPQAHANLQRVSEKKKKKGRVRGLCCCFGQFYVISFLSSRLNEEGDHYVTN